LAADRTEVDRVFNETEVVAIDRSKWFTAFSPTTYYLGLREGDNLGVRVFIEHVARYPGLYFESAIRRSFFFFKEGWFRAWFPLVSDLDRFERKKYFNYELAPDSLMGGGRDRFKNPYGYTVWGPGVYFFNLLSLPFLLPNALFSLIMVIGAITPLFAFDKTAAYFRSNIIYLLLILLIFLFVLFSNLVLGFRPTKELILIMPVISVVFSVSFLRVYGLLREKFEILSQGR
jgi:hypothetical protein